MHEYENDSLDEQNNSAGLTCAFIEGKLRMIEENNDFAEEEEEEMLNNIMCHTRMQQTYMLLLLSNTYQFLRYFNQVRYTIIEYRK